jgi:hypothetical protein
MRKANMNEKLFDTIQQMEKPVLNDRFTGIG